VYNKYNNSKKTAVPKHNCTSKSSTQKHIKKYINRYLNVILLLILKKEEVKVLVSDVGALDGITVVAWIKLESSAEAINSDTVIGAKEFATNSEFIRSPKFWDVIELSRIAVKLLNALDSVYPNFSMITRTLKETLVLFSSLAIITRDLVEVGDDDAVSMDVILISDGSILPLNPEHTAALKALV
jgi:hypothetical protein